MKLNKNAVTALGAVLSLALAGGVAGLVVLPQIDDLNKIQREVGQIDALRVTKEAHLQTLRDAEPTIGTITQEALVYAKLLPTELDIASIGRALGTALPGDVALREFSYGAAVAIPETTELVVSLAPQEVPVASTGPAAAAPAVEEGEEGAATPAPAAGAAGVQAVPLNITISAPNVSSAMNFARALGTQERFIRVDQMSLRGDGEAVTASIFAYAYINGDQQFIDWLLKVQAPAPEEVVAEITEETTEEPVGEVVEEDAGAPEDEALVEETTTEDEPVE